MFKLSFCLIVFCSLAFFSALPQETEAKEATHLDLQLLEATLKSTWLTEKERIHAVWFFKDIIAAEHPDTIDFELVIAHLLTENVDEHGRPLITQEDLDRLHEAYPTTCSVSLEEMKCATTDDCMCIFDYDPTPYYDAGHPEDDSVSEDSVVYEESFCVYFDCNDDSPPKDDQAALDIAYCRSIMCKDDEPEEKEDL